MQRVLFKILYDLYIVQTALFYSMDAGVVNAQNKAGEKTTRTTKPES